MTKSAVLTIDNATQNVANAGDVITYNVVVTNTGNVTLTNLQVQDIFENGSPTTLSCLPITLNPNQSVSCASYNYVVTNTDIETGGVLENSVTASAVATISGSVVTVQESASAVLPLDDTASEMRVIKTATPRDVRVGELVRYTVQIENSGVNAIQDATLIDTPPPGFTLVVGSLVVSDQDNSGRLVATYPIKVDQIDIATGARATISYLLRVGAAIQPGVYQNKAYVVDGIATSNTATADVQVVGDPLIDQSLILGTVFDDRNSNGFQDPARLKNVHIQGGFSAKAYVANSTTIDKGDGAKPEPDSSSPMLHGIAIGTIAGRQSEADTAFAHQVVISQILSSPEFTDDLVLTADDGITLTMNALGNVSITNTLAITMPTLERRVSKIAEGYRVDYIIANEGIDERGIPGVRIATVEGLIVETDSYGRFSLQGIQAGQWNRGRNFIMKVDKVTLPPESIFTTDNPLVRRITPGLPVRFDFGVKLPSGLMKGGTKEMEIEISQIFFAPESSEVRKEYAPAIVKIADHVRSHPATEVVITADGSTLDIAYDRAKSVQAALMAILSPQEAQSLKVTLKDNVGNGNETLLSLGINPMLGSILFSDDKSIIRPQYDAVINRIAKDVEKLAGADLPIVITVVGYTDRRGSFSYNETLGLRRAKAVYDAIAEKLSVDARNKLRIEINKSPPMTINTNEGKQ